jgi:hypothetical protein
MFHFLFFFRTKPLVLFFFFFHFGPSLDSHRTRIEETYLPTHCVLGVTRNEPIFRSEGDWAVGFRVSVHFLHLLFAIFCVS